MKNTASNPQITVYTPVSQMRTPGALLASMWRDIKASRELSWRFFVRSRAWSQRQTLTSRPAEPGGELTSAGH